MTTLILSSNKNESEFYTSHYGTYSDGKISAQVAVRKAKSSLPSEVWVCCQNASHKVFRGMGKRFASVSEALANYKSPAMRQLITAAVGEAQFNGVELEPEAVS